ncbi:hypothetical protein CR513_55502, partial [Mucuna pruriens]
MKIINIFKSLHQNVPNIGSIAKNDNKIFEYEELRSWIKYLNLDVTLISKNIAKADDLRIYMREKERLKEEVTSIPSRISLTSDLRTSCNIEVYWKSGRVVESRKNVLLFHDITTLISRTSYPTPNITGVEELAAVKERKIEEGIRCNMAGSSSFVPRSLPVFDGKLFDNWRVKMLAIFGFQDMIEMVTVGFVELDKNATKE